MQLIKTWFLLIVCNLVKNMSDNDFKYLSKEFSGEFLKLVKQKGFLKINYLIGLIFLVF